MISRKKKISEKKSEKKILSFLGYKQQKLLRTLTLSSKQESWPKIEMLSHILFILGIGVAILLIEIKKNNELISKKIKSSF